MNLFGILFLLTSQNCVLGVEYGPSISSLTGVFVNWRGPDIFSVESGRRVKLESFPGFAAVIPLIKLGSKATSEQIFQERGISTVGEFTVEAPRGFGIMAVVQELRLRKTTRERSNNVTCSDYLQIGQIGGSEGNGAVSSKICGIVNRDDLSIKPEGLIGPRSFRSSSGRLRIAFNHAYVAELVDSLLGSKQKHILRAEVAFTAYKTNCYESTNSTTETSNDEETFEICSDFTKSDNQTCISSKLLCDDVYNCGGDSETIGSDDSVSTCPDKPIRTTTEKSPDEENNEDKPDGYGNLATYLGIPSLSSFTTKKYERKFRPYVSSSQSGSGFSFDFNSRRTSTEGPPLKVLSSTTEAVESAVSSGSKAVNSNSASNPQDLRHMDTEIYNRRELSHAINSVIYGVAVFIIFTIFITVFIVVITKKIQMTLSERSGRNSIESRSTTTTVSTPSIIPTTTTTVITHNRTGHNCNALANGEMSYAPPNTTVVLLTLPQSVEQCDLPPSYDTLFPDPHQC